VANEIFLLKSIVSRCHKAGVSGHTLPYGPLAYLLRCEIIRYMQIHWRSVALQSLLTNRGL
jgi:hypothetical protein